MIDAERRAVAVAQLLGQHRFAFADEDGLQHLVHTTLLEAGLRAEREVRLSGRDRIDVLVYDVGIECKVDGSPNRILEQLLRYSEHDRIGALVLVTNKPRHRLPDTVGGKPLRTLITLGGL